MKIWTKDPIQRVQLIGRIRKLVDGSNKKAAERSLVVNKEREIMVRLSQFHSLFPKFSYILVLFLVELWLFERIQWFFQVNEKKWSSILFRVIIFLCILTVIASIFFVLSSSEIIETAVKIKTVAKGNTFIFKKVNTSK